MKQTFDKRRLLLAAGLAVLGVIGAWLLWQWANDMSGVRREAPKVPAIIPLPPPPPPPPEPPPEPPKEPVEEKVVEPEPMPEPEEVKPADEAPPNPAEDLANPMQMDGDAQSGNDAFNVGAGKGGGMAGRGGGGLGTGTYNNLAAAQMLKRLREDPELRNQAFSAQVDVWLSEAGELLRVELVRSTGNAEHDQRIKDALLTSPPIAQRPPGDMKMPMRVNLKGRRP